MTTASSTAALAVMRAVVTASVWVSFDMASFATG
jgi:hypothetical protein